MNNGELSPKELKLLENREYMPMKVKVCRKIESWLSELHDQLRKSIENDESLTLEFRQSKGRISRGENYKSYAYRVLDYPSLIDKEDIFLFRTIVLWGDSIGFHLILSGKYWERYGKKIESIDSDSPLPLMLSIQNSPWIWESQHPELIPWKKEAFPQISRHFQDKGFAKLSAFLSLNDYQDLLENGFNLWRFWKDKLL